MSNSHYTGKEYTKSTSAAAGREEDSGGGLSLVHISPQAKGQISRLASAQFWVGGGLVKVQRENEECGGAGPGGMRGQAQFSYASRRRLLFTLSKVKREAVPVFVTLTYPGEFSSDALVWKKDLDDFSKRFRRRWSSGCFVWRLEFQKRGAPHFHLLVWGASYVELFTWVSRAWYQVVGSGDQRHLMAGTRVEELRDYRGALGYASKYLGKVDQVKYKDVGRWWGIVGRKNIPWARLVVAAISNPDACEFLRYLRRFAHLKSRDYKSLTVMCDAEFWLLKLDFLWKKENVIMSVT